MRANDQTILKRVLREEGLPVLGKQSKYFSTAAVKAWLDGAYLLVSIG